MKQNDWQFDDMSSNTGAHKQLAQWLQLILAAQPDAAAAQAENDEVLTSSAPGAQRYHLRYYQQLPDVVMTLLNYPGDYQKLAAYTPLLAHLVTCPDCRAAYADLYRALHPTFVTSQTLPPNNYKIPALAAIPSGSLVHLCHSLIMQAEAILREAHRRQRDDSAAARSLLQQAMRFSLGITQREMRGQALSDLVRVATLFDGPHSPGEQTPAPYAYTSLAGAGGPRRGTRTIRRGGMATRSHDTPSDTPTIYLQARHLEGSITQEGDTLILHLHDLDKALRGHHLLIAVPLGVIIEPVQWLGGNPKAIRSIAPVTAGGTLDTPLGTTSLNLADHEDRGMLEVMFMLLEVRPGD